MLRVLLVAVLVAVRADCFEKVVVGQGVVFAGVLFNSTRASGALVSTT
jgi:hypothetical protein